jgi:hypothetical protein
MPNTISELVTYLEMLDISKKDISKIISRDDIVLYSILRDKLSNAELLELQIILKNVYNRNENPLDIDFSKFVEIDKKERKLVADLLHLKTNSALELATIIQLDTKDLAFNIVNTL